MSTGAAWRDDETLLTTGMGGGGQRKEEWVPGLTILAHADPRRVGERLALPVLTVGREVRLSRLEPSFKAPHGSELRSLEDRSVSRRPIRMVPDSETGSVVLDRSDTQTPIVADGEPIEDRRSFSAAEIIRGVVLLIGRRIALLLHQISMRPVDEEADFGLIGESESIVQVRREIHRLARFDVPVLLRGATGTGKELVAEALHKAGPRRSEPFVAVNMAAVPPSLAASELFGAVRGAYTGADRQKIGYFQTAQNGTLFLDEIGDTPAEVQPMLLRALETQEILPVGSVKPQKTEARIIAATDARLESSISAGRFRAPLLHRLAGYTVRLPTLAERRDDIGRLFYFFLEDELAKIGESAQLAVDETRAWPPAALVARLARYNWPGNVRELRNVVRWIAITGRGLGSDQIDAQLEELLTQTESPQTATAPRPAAERKSFAPRRRRLRKPSEVSEEELLTVLKSHSYELRATARALGVSRANLYRLIESCPTTRTAADLTLEEIEAALACCDGTIATAAMQLGVSARGLKRRTTALGLTLH